MRNKWLWIILAIAVVITVVLVLANIEPEPISEIEEPIELKEIKIGYLSGTATQFGLPILVAKEKGFFREEGLEAKLIEAEPATAAPALLSGEIDYSPFSTTEITASLKGASISSVMLTSKGPYHILVAQPGLEINELKTIGISFLNTPPHYQALKFMKEYNLELEIIASGTPAATVAMLVRGDVDAIITVDLRAVQLQAEGFQLLKKFDDIYPSILSTKKEKIENNPEEVQGVINALQKSIEYILQTGPEEISEFMLKHFGMNATEENLKLVKSAYPFIVKELDRRGLAVDEGIEIVIKHSKAGNYQTLQDIEGQTVTQEEIRQVFDSRFVE